MLAARTTLAQFLNRERRRHSTEDLDPLVLDIARSCGEISAGLASGDCDTEVLGEQTLDVRGRYLVAFEPLDVTSVVAPVTGSVGSFFSVLRAPDPDLSDGRPPSGSQQVCAGYAIYGPATVLVLTVGTGVFSFALDPRAGEFTLLRSHIRIPATTNEFAVDISNSRFWGPSIKRYVDECLAGCTGPRAKDFALHWATSLVAATHRVLSGGGVFLCPRTSTRPAMTRRPSLLFEANPVAMLIEQAGGLASTGLRPVLDVVPDSPRQRTGLVFGASEEVRRIERYHATPRQTVRDAPFFGDRGLFRVGG